MTNRKNHPACCRTVGAASRSDYAQKEQPVGTASRGDHLQKKQPVGAASRGDYVQDKVRPGTGREGALGYERYIAIEHMEVRRDCFSLAQDFRSRGETPLPQRDAPPTYQGSQRSA